MLTDEQYNAEIERLAKAVVHEAVKEGQFEVFADGNKTPLQQTITDMARTLRYQHHVGDGCVPEHSRESFPPEADTAVSISRIKVATKP